MNILNRLTIKHLKLNKKRTIVTIVGIILSTAMMVGIGLLISTAREYTVQEVINNNGSYNSAIENMDLSKLSIIKANKNVKNYYYEYGLGYAKYLESDNSGKPYFYINAVSSNYFEELKLIDGTFPTNSEEIVVSNHIFNQGKSIYKIGDTITLEIGDRVLEGEVLHNNNPYEQEEYFQIKSTKTYKIVGIVERSHYENYSSPGFYLFTLNDRKDATNARLYLTFNNPKNTVKLTEIINKNLGYQDVSNVDYNNSLLALYGSSSYSNVNNFFSGFLVIFLSIISVACVIVIYNSFAISVMERKKQFGLFASIGATKRQIRKTVYFEAFLVGSIGIFLGILGAYLGIGVVILIMNNLLKDVFLIGLTLTTYPLFMIIPIIFIIITIFISSLIPARSASRISPIEVIRQNDDIKVNKRSIRTPKFISRLFGIEGEIALKNIKRNKKKYRITIISLFISIVTFIAFSAYLNYGSSTVNSYADQVNFDILVSTQKTEANINNANTILQSDGIDEKLILTSTYVGIKYIPDKYLVTPENKDKERVFDNILVLKMDDKNYDIYKKQIGLSTDKPIMYNKYTKISYHNNSRKVIESNVYTKDPSMILTFCDFIEMDDYINENGDISEEYYSKNCTNTLSNFFYTNSLPPILEKYINNPKGVLIVNETLYNNILKRDNNNSSIINEEYNIYIKAKNQNSLDKIGNKFVGDIHYYNVSKQAQTTNNIVLAISILLYGLITLITLIGVTSVFNTINTSINLRRKEFSILRSIGLTPKGFNKMIWFESIIFGIKSLIYGLPVGILLTYIIGNNMHQLVESGYIFPLKPVIICIVAVFVIIVITMRYATNKIKKENILNAITNENI